MLPGISSGLQHEIVTGAKGSPWTLRGNVSGQFNVIEYGGVSGGWIALAFGGTNRIWRSASPISGWTPATPPNLNAWQSAAHGNGRWVCFASSGTADTDKRCMVCLDGSNTFTAVTVPAVAWRDVIWVPELAKFFAVGPNTLISSPDGFAWTTIPLPINCPWSSVLWNPILGRLVLVSQAASMVPSQALISDNAGATWTETFPKNSSWGRGLWDGSQFVWLGGTFGGRQIMTSPDGEAFADWATPVANWGGIAYGDGLYAAVNFDIANRVMTSRNAEQWRLRDPVILSPWADVAFGAGVFCAVATNGDIMTAE